MLEQLLKNLPAEKEELFQYFDVSSKYEITIMDLKKGTKVPDHSHDQNVYNYLLEGSLEFHMAGKSITKDCNSWMYIDKDSVHSVTAIEDCKILELWEK